MGLFPGPVGVFDYIKKISEICPALEKTINYYKKVNGDYDYLKDKIHPLFQKYLAFGKKIKESRSKFMSGLDKVRNIIMDMEPTEAIKYKMKPYMDFFTSLVLATLSSGIEIPERFNDMNYLKLVEIALK